MTVTLQQLSDDEVHIFNDCDFAKQHPEFKINVNQNNRLYNDYKSIHNEYLNICRHSGDDNVRSEALKRMIFLNWYYQVEPTHLTAIEELDEATIAASYAIFNDYIKGDYKLDSELTWMIYFYSLWDYVILEYSEHHLKELTDFVKFASTRSWTEPTPNYPQQNRNIGIMENRGQMGDYFKRVQHIS